MLPTRLVPALAVLVAACGGRTLVVESDTEWAGTVSAVGQVAGRGAAEFELSATRDESCWTIGKLSEAGTLRVYAETDTWFGLGNEIDAEATTTAPMGSVQGCVR